MMDAIMLTVTPATLAVIANALHQRPYIEVAAILADMERQVQSQQMREIADLAAAEPHDKQGA